MMQKVLIISRDTIFRSGMEALLTSNPDLVVKVLDVEKEMLQVALEYQPNLLLVQREAEPYSLHQVYEIFRAIDNADQCRVLAIELDSNRVSIYDKRIITITEMKDLLNLI